MPLFLLFIKMTRIVYFLKIKLLFSVLFFCSTSHALTIKVTNGDDLQEIIKHAASGDIIEVAKGNYHGNLLIDKEITLTGFQQPHIIGIKKGHAIKITANNVVIENFIISESGLDLSTQDSGVFVDKGAENVIVRHNKIVDNLIGVYLWGSINSLVDGNTIIGQKSHRVNDRGNGVQVWNSPGSVVSNNHISFGRDGIFTTTSRNNRFTHNYFDNLRYSIHYMYTKDSVVSDNYSTQNKIGYALMFSSGLTVENNISVNDFERGLFSNFLNKTTINDNIILGPSKKCLMLYNSNFNTINNNHFERCNIGVHYTAGSQDNLFKGNNFIQNYKQVKYVGTKYVEWSTEKLGNFWSDHAAFDLNTDGIADAVYRPNSITDQVLWRNSNTKVLLNSPAIQILKWSQSYFPSLLPGGAQDSYPLLQPVKQINYESIMAQTPEEYLK